MQNLNHPKVSIGMPVYNGGRFLESSIDSVLCQSFTDFELIISDNASTDDTEKTCLEYAQRDSRIRYIRQPENVGANKNFAFVRDQAQGSYFMWTAADDLCDPEFVTELVRILDNYPDVALAMSDVKKVNDSGSVLKIALLDNIRVQDVLHDWDRKVGLFFENPTTQIFFAIYGLYRTEAVQAASLNYREMVKYATGSEIPFLAQIALQGVIVSIPDELKTWRVHAESIYHSENSKSSLFRKVDNYLNISRALLEIIFRSQLTLLRQIWLSGLVVKNAFAYLPMFILKAFVRRLIGRRP